MTRKRTTSCLALAIASLLAACNPVQPTPPLQEAEEVPSAFDALVGPARWHEYGEVDVLRYEIDVAIDPERKHIQGEVRYRLRAQRALTEVRLDSIHGGEWSVHFFQEKELPLRQIGDRVYLKLDDEIGPGREFTLRAELLGTPPDGFFFTENRYGRPVAFTDHFPARARGWFPSEDHPADRAHFSLRLAIPHGYDVVCTGPVRPARAEGADDWIPAGMVGWEGATESEIPTYLMAIAVAPFARIAEKGDSRLMPHFVYAEDVELARPALTHHAAWMRRMEETFGTYMYAKYCVVQVPTRFGGMEHAGNTWVNEALFDQDDRGVGTLAHEFAHQWFGDGVGYADWYDVWLSEGFASYLGPWLQASTGGPSLEESLAEMRARWLRSDVGSAKPVRWKGYGDPDEAFNANAYPKGGWILHMLRGELGDEVFFRGLRNYYGQFGGQAVRTRDLQTVLEQTSRQELGWFFEQWLDRPGCPELSFEWTPHGVVVRQEQAGEPYRFRLPLRWKGVAGTAYEGTFRIEKRLTTLELDGSPIVDPEVDPHVELLYRPVER